MKVKLGDICNFYAGTGFPVAYQGKDSGELPFYKVGDIANNVSVGKTYLELCNNYISREDARVIKGVIVPKGTVVFAKIGEALKLNRRAITSCDCLIDNNAMGIAPISSFLKEKYFFYYMKHLKMQELAESTTVPSVRKSKLEAVIIEVPTIQEQEKIENQLDKISNIIIMRKQQLQQLDDLVKARFVEMFGDPVKNNKGWKYKALNDVCDGIGDGLHGTPIYDDNGDYPFINGNNLIDGKIVVTPATKMVSEETYNKHLINISRNAILISINGTLGKLSFYNGEQVMLGKSACYCNLKKDVNKVFVYGVMKSESFAEFLDNSSTKSTIKNVGLKAIREFKLILPPVELQEQFATFVKQVDKSKVAVQKALDEAQTLFDSLMQEYFG